MMQILDTIMVTLFVLFMIYIFRGYHLTRLDRDRTQSPRNLSEEDETSVSSSPEKDT